MSENYFNPGARPNGYYWVRVRWEPDWKPAEWDNEIGCWLMIGQKEPFYDFQMAAIGNKFNIRGEDNNGRKP